MNVSKKVDTIKRLQGRYVALQKGIQERIAKITKPVEQHIRERLVEEFPDVDCYFLSGFRCGCLSDKWQPQVFVYRVNELSYAPEGYWYKERENSEYFELPGKEQPPVPTRRFLAFLKTLSDEMGIKITMVRQKPYWVDGNKDVDWPVESYQFCEAKC